MRLTTRELVTLAVFGTLWGFGEVSLGAVLKSFNLPLSGAVLAAIGLGFVVVLTAVDGFTQSVDIT